MIRYLVLSLFVTSQAVAQTLSFDPLAFVAKSDEVALPDDCDNVVDGAVDVEMKSDWNAQNSDPLRMRFYHTNPSATRKIFVLGGGPGEDGASTKSFLEPIFSGAFSSYDFIYFDHRGAGCSQLTSSSMPLPLSVLTMEQATEDLHHYISKNAFEPVYLFGVSYGTFLTQAFTQKYPSLVRAMVLDSTFGDAAAVGDSNKAALEFVQKLFAPYRIETLASFYDVELSTFYWWLANMSMEDSFVNGDMRQKILEMSEQSYIDVRAKFAENPFQKLSSRFSKRLYYGLGCQQIWDESQSGTYLYDFYFDFTKMCPALLRKHKVTSRPFNFNAGEKVDVRALILSGEDDFSTPAVAAKRVFHHHRNAQFVSVSKTNHAVIAREPKFVANVMETFFTKGYLEKSDVQNASTLLADSKSAILFSK